MTKTQSRTTVHDHPVNPWNLAQKLFGAELATLLCHTMIQTVMAGVDEHPDWRAALLQRAAVITQGTIASIQDSADQAAPGQEYLFQDAYETAVHTMDWIANISTLMPAPGLIEPDPAPEMLRAEPGLNVDQDPNRYWSWLQAHIQAVALPDSIEAMTKYMAAKPVGDQTTTEMLGAAAHALNVISHGVARRREMPEQTPLDGMHKHDLVTIRDAAIKAVDHARESVEKLSERHYRELPREFSKAVIAHPSLVDAIEGKPLPPCHVRTVVTPPNDPNGAVAALAFHSGSSIIAQLITEPPPANFPPELFFINITFAIPHLSLDLEQDGTEPAESVRISILTSMTGVTETVESLKPETIHAIMQVASQRQVPENAIQESIKAACQPTGPAGNQALSDADLPPQHCSTELFEQVAQSAQSHGADAHLIQALAEFMNIPSYLLNLPRAIVNDQQFQHVAAVVKQEGLPEFYLGLWRKRTDDGSSVVYHPPPPYQDLHPTPSEFYNPPAPNGATSQCECDTCHRMNRNNFNTPRDAYNLAIRHQGDAYGLRALMAHHNDVRTTHDAEADRMLDTIQDLTTQLGHYSAVNQVHSTHPYPDLMREINETALAARHYLDQTGQKNTLSNAKERHKDAINTMALIYHAEAAANEHQRHLEKQDASLEEQLRRLHALNRLLNVVKISQMHMKAQPPQTREKAALMLEVTDEDEDVVVTLIRIINFAKQEILRETPTKTSQKAAKHPELLKEMDYHTGSPLVACYQHTIDRAGKPAKPSLVRRYHEGCFHIRTTEEPCPKGYPWTWMPEDEMEMVTETILACGQRPDQSLLMEATRQNVRATFGVHDIQQEAWPKIAQAAKEAGLPPTAINHMMAQLKGGTFRIHDVVSDQQQNTEQNADRETASKILEDATAAGANPYQILRLAVAMDQPSLAPEIPPIAVRHVRAIVKTARQRGVPLESTAKMKAALLDPTNSIRKTTAA